MRRGGRIAKPRALFWEWLLLSAESPLRRLLSDAAARDGLGEDAFDFLPTLEFYDARSLAGGEVQAIELEPLGRMSGARRQELAVVLGRSLALWSWLGVADLHWENLALGVDARGRAVFGPLDIEMILADLSLPTETKLLPDADPEYAEICRHAAGARRMLPFLGKPIAPAELLTVAAEYVGTLDFLERQRASIARLLAELPELRVTPLRVLLRGTADYLNAGAELWPPLLEAEQEQLDRGDVPYFFRLYGRAGIHYYADAALTKLERLPLRGDVPQLEPLLDVKRGLRSPARDKLRADGLFTLLGAFDDASLTGRHRSERLTLEFGARRISVSWPNGEQLTTSRNLSAFVGSVYLPCRCGEVRSVLVPPKTRCRPVDGSRF